MDMRGLICPWNTIFLWQLRAQTKCGFPWISLDFPSECNEVGLILTRVVRVVLMPQTTQLSGQAPAMCNEHLGGIPAAVTERVQHSTFDLSSPSSHKWSLEVLQAN